MKHEAGGVLGEVKRKQTDATKAVELLKALRKLREARKQEAEVKGKLLLDVEQFPKHLVSLLITSICFHQREIQCSAWPLLYCMLCKLSL